jgi:hypothetical protein
MAAKYYYNLMVYLFSEKRFGKEELCFVASFFWQSLSQEYKNRWRQKARRLNLNVAPFWLFALKIEKSLFYDKSYFDYIWPHVIQDAKHHWANLVSQKTWRIC